MVDEKATSMDIYRSLGYVMFRKDARMPEICNSSKIHKGERVGSEFVLYSAGETRIPAKSTALVKTGLGFDIPVGFEIRIDELPAQKSRGHMILNKPGTIDAGYHDELGIIVYNETNTELDIPHGYPIAKGEIRQFEKAKLTTVGRERGKDGVLFDLSEGAKLPAYEKEDSAGLDIASVEKVVLKPGESRAIKTGMKINIPQRLNLEIRSRRDRKSTRLNSSH